MQPALSHFAFLRSMWIARSRCVPQCVRFPPDRPYDAVRMQPAPTHFAFLRSMWIAASRCVPQCVFFPPGRPNDAVLPQWSHFALDEPNLGFLLHIEAHSSRASLSCASSVRFVQLTEELSVSYKRGSEIIALSIHKMS